MKRVELCNSIEGEFHNSLFPTFNQKIPAAFNIIKQQSTPLTLLHNRANRDCIKKAKYSRGGADICRLLYSKSIDAAEFVPRTKFSWTPDLKYKIGFRLIPF